MPIETEMLLAARRMCVLELCDGRSADYIVGVLAGITLQTDFTEALLSPGMRRMSETIDRLAGELSRAS